MRGRAKGNLNDVNKNGFRGLSAAVVSQAYKDLVNFSGNELKKLECELNNGGLDLYLSLLGMPIMTEDLIKKAIEERKRKCKKTMTKKRFKKLLMGAGYQRNEVNEIIKSVQRKKLPYSEAYRIYKFFSCENSPSQFAALLNEGLTEAIKVIGKVARAAVEAIKAFTETFIEAMKEEEAEAERNINNA